MYYSTSDEMSRLDELAVKNGLKIRQMMELAGWHMVSVFEKLEIQPPKNVVILAGKGNKGGDGIAAARHLVNYGFDVAIVLSTREISKDSEHHLRMAEKMNIPIFDWQHQAQEMLQECAVVVDALIGYRLVGPPKGVIEQISNYLHELKNKTVIAYDIPTGLDASTGECYAPCLTVDATLTLALPKRAQNSAGKQHYGRTFVADIGIPAYLYDKISEGSRPEFKSGLLEID